MAESGKILALDKIVQGYEFEKDHFVMFAPAELKAVKEGANPETEIVSFIPENAVDPLF